MDRTEDVKFVYLLFFLNLFNWLYTNMLLKDMFWFCAGLGDAPVARQQNGRRLILFGRYHSPEKRESEAVKGHKHRLKHTLSSIGDLHIKLHVLYLKYSEMTEMTKCIVHCGFFFFLLFPISERMWWSEMEFGGSTDDAKKEEKPLG